jgi:nicotinate phosphoribosyltransferase
MRFIQDQAIVRSRLDADFYKLLMGQLIYEKHPRRQVTFALTNRTTEVRLAGIIDVEELREHLDAARRLRYTAPELNWLRTQRFYGQAGLFKPAFIDHLAESRLPDYDLRADRVTGQFNLRFQGIWPEVTDWEVHALSIVSELRNRAVLRALEPAGIEIIYTRARAKLAAKLRRLADVPDLTISDFGTRRRHNFLWQEQCILAARAALGRAFVGTSNTYLAMQHGLEAKGTSGHELPMAYAAMAAANPDNAATDSLIRRSQYAVLSDWQQLYGDTLTIAVPDTWGTTQFLENAPPELLHWKGFRPDSKPPAAAVAELVAWWQAHGIDPRQRLIVLSDGLDVETGLEGFEPGDAPLKTMGPDIPSLQESLGKFAALTYGWGTTLTNDFAGCVPGRPDALKPISLVCKVESVDGVAAVKFSDNLQKGLGQPAMLARFQRIFGMRGLTDLAVAL